MTEAECLAAIGDGRMGAFYRDTGKNPLDPANERANINEMRKIYVIGELAKSEVKP